MTEKCEKGFDLKEGKCVKSSESSYIPKRRKSYNPFYMWGSWIGMIVSLIYFLFSTKLVWFDARDIILRLFGSLDPQTGGFISGTILTLVLGFLVGWIINILIRMFKK